MKSPLTKAPRTDIDSSHKLCYTLCHGVIGLTMIQDRSLLPLVYSLCDKSGFCKTCNLKVGFERKRGHRHLAIYRSVLSTIAPNIVSFANLLLVFCLCLSIEINHYLGIFYDMPTHRPRVLLSQILFTSAHTPVNQKPILMCTVSSFLRLFCTYNQHHQLHK